MSEQCLEHEWVELTTYGDLPTRHYVCAVCLREEWKRGGRLIDPVLHDPKVGACPNWNHKGFCSPAFGEGES